MSENTANILIIDDEAPLRRLAGRMLGKQYQVHECGTGNEALELLGSHEFHLLLVDHSLPDINGSDLVKRIRTGRPHQRVVYVSGHSREACLSPEEQSYPATGFLQKPFTRDSLQLTVETYLPKSVSG